MADELTAGTAATLGSLTSIIATVNGLLAAGLSAAGVAEKLLAFVNPTDAAALESLIKVLQEVQSLLAKV